MPTTGGALAFAGYMPPYEATLTKNLREAGAIIIAKTTLIELANWVAGAPTPMSGYNAVAGFGFNPYDPRVDPREAAMAARCCRPVVPVPARAPLPASGRPTSAATPAGPSRSPRIRPCWSGMRPTIGRISRYGVIPITADHDTAGPMTRTVTDAAILLGALEAPRPIPTTPRRKTCTPPPGRDYTKFLKRDGLKGARIGIPRAFYYDRRDTARTRSDPAADLNPQQAKVDGRRHRRAQATRGDDRRSRRDPQLRR